jgi:hypothetical protein
MARKNHSLVILGVFVVLVILVVAIFFQRSKEGFSSWSNSDVTTSATGGPYNYGNNYYIWYGDSRNLTVTTTTSGAPSAKVKVSQSSKAVGATQATWNIKISGSDIANLNLLTWYGKKITYTVKQDYDVYKSDGTFYKTVTGATIWNADLTIK